MLTYIDLDSGTLSGGKYWRCDPAAELACSQTTCGSRSATGTARSTASASSARRTSSRHDFSFSCSFRYADPQLRLSDDIRLEAAYGYGAARPLRLRRQDALFPAPRASFS